ncbi:MAG TPA: radical SAM protein [Thermoanaerobaculia bacterium]|nr:radical SAM protein [Thermoanaerobaculia bacterium]
MSGTRLAQAFALARDWIAPGEALAQWTHFVTSVCNARCAHCFYPINAGKNELTLDEIEKLTRTLPPIRLLLIGGGEPFLRRDLDEIVRLYFERTRFFTCSIPTNGFGPEEIARAAQRICGFDSGLSFGVTVSLDGFRSFHDTVRRLPGLYDRAVATLEALLALSRSTPNLTVGVTTVFMRDNQKDFEAFGDFVYETYRPHQHSINLIRGEAYDPGLKDNLDVALYERVCEKTDSRYPPGEVRSGWRGVRTRARREVNRLRYEYIARQARGGDFEQFCLAGEREFVLSEDGVVYGCELIGDSLGNVRDYGYDFRKLRAGSVVAAFEAKKRATLCKCTHECNTRTMLLFDRANALPVLSAMAGLRSSPSPPGRGRRDGPS